MQSKYIVLLIIIMGFQIPFKSHAQNTPNSETYPSGSSTSIATPQDAISYDEPNNVHLYTPVIPITDTASVNLNSAAANVKQQVVYSDGFQRTYETITKNIAYVGGQLKNLVTLSDNSPKRDQFTFLPYSANDGNLQLYPFTLQKNYYTTNYPNEGGTGYSQNTNISSATQYATQSYSPGKSQVGQLVGATTITLANAANEVRIWNLDANNKPVCTGYYGAGELFVQETDVPGGLYGNSEDQQSPRTKIYKDRDGKTILKLQADYNNIQGMPPYQVGVLTWQETYYVYDEKGNEVYILPPLASQNVDDNSGILTPDALQGLCFQNVYDNKERQIGSQKPGESDFTYLVYDRKNRVVMHQTPNERNNGEWEVTLFDGLNRVKETFIYSDNQNRETWQNLVDAGSSSGILYYLTTLDGEKAYRDNSSTMQNDPGVMVINYYDDYSNGVTATAGTSLTAGDLVTTATAITPVQSKRTYGLLTESLTRILKSPSALSSPKVADYRQTIFNYDDKGRVIYSESNELSFPSTITHHVNTATQYDFSGNILLLKNDVFNGNNNLNNSYPAGQPDHLEWTKNNYDLNTGALTKILHKVDNGAWVTLASYSYDDLGRVKTETLGEGGEVRTMTYDIRGAKIGINGVYAETGGKGGHSMTFGESLKSDFGFKKKRWDGKLAGMIWRGGSATNMYAYGYDYDLSGNLASADFTHYEGQWSNASIDYSVSDLSYDKNGNILTMNQRGVKPGVGPYDMDRLTYNYEGGNNTSNHLTNVNDQTGISGNGLGDFEGNSNYSYDPNGNLLTDDGNKKIQGNILYTRLNKPLKINFDNDRSIEYSYDALGNKVQELVKDGSTQKYKETDYIGDFVYQNTYDAGASDFGGQQDTLQYILTSQGRTIVDPLTNASREEYFVKDHLGNVRSVIDVSGYPLATYLATYELASAHLESLVWDNIDDVRDIRPGGTGDNSMAANLNGIDPSRTIGTSILLQVMAGDKVSMNVNTYFNGYDPSQDSPLPASTVMNQIISTLTGGVGGLGGSESHNTKIVSSVFNTNNYNSLNSLITANTDPSLPKAYLNYVLFDKNMKIVSQMSGAFQATGNGAWSQIGTTSALEIPQSGFLAVYISNTSMSRACSKCSDVYFDQLTLALSHGNLLEENHYYPHGLPIFGLGSTTADVNYKGNRYKYQSNEYITDQGLNWMSFGARQYDPQVGRFLSIDPKASLSGQDIFAPYVAMGNLPETNIDPNGMAFHMNLSSQYLMVAQTGMGDQSGGGSGSGGNGGPLDADLNDIMNSGAQAVANAQSMEAIIDNATDAMGDMTGNVGVLDGSGNLVSEGNVDIPTSSSSDPGASPDNYKLEADGTVSVTPTKDKSNSFYATDGSLIARVGSNIYNSTFGKGDGPTVAWNLVHTALGLTSNQFKTMLSRGQAEGWDASKLVTELQRLQGNSQKLLNVDAVASFNSNLSILPGQGAREGKPASLIGVFIPKVDAVYSALTGGKDLQYDIINLPRNVGNTFKTNVMTWINQFNNWPVVGH